MRGSAKRGMNMHMHMYMYKSVKTTRNRRNQRVRGFADEEFAVAPHSEVWNSDEPHVCHSAFAGERGTGVVEWRHVSIVASYHPHLKDG